MPELIFLAEIKETKQTKPQLDNIYSLRVITDDSRIMDLGKLPPDTVVQVTINTKYAGQS